MHKKDAYHKSAAPGGECKVAKIETSIVIDRPAETVWKFVADPSNASKYDHDIISAKQTSDGPVAVGTTFEENRRKEGKSTFRTAEYDPGRSWTWVVTSPRAMEGSKMNIVVEDIGGKTKLTNTTELKLGGFYRLMGPFVARSLRKIQGAQANQVKRILETEATS